MVSAIMVAAFTQAIALPQPECTLALTGAMVWVDGHFERRDLAIADDGTIRGSEVSACARELSLPGHFISPPFGEGHTHNIEPQWLLDSVNQRYLAEGVFYVQNANAYPPAVAALQSRLAEPGTINVAFAMGGLTSYHGHPEPVYVITLSGIMYGGMERAGFVGQAFHTIEQEADIAPALDLLQEQGADFVKIYLVSSENFAERHARMSDDAFWSDTVSRVQSGELEGEAYAGFLSENVTGLNPELVAPIVAAAQARGLRVMAHVSTSNDFSVAVRAGVDGVLHMPGAYFGPDESADTYRLSDGAIERAAETGAFVVATANVRPAFISNDTRQAVHSLQAENIRRLREAGIPVLIGTDRWNEISFDEVRHLVTIGAMSPADAFAAWIDTGRAIFPDRQIGAIAPGYEADLLVFSQNPAESLEGMRAISHRIMDGELLDLPAE